MSRQELSLETLLSEGLANSSARNSSLEREGGRTEDISRESGRRRKRRGRKSYTFVLFVLLLKFFLERVLTVHFAAKKGGIIPIII